MKTIRFLAILGICSMLLSGCSTERLLMPTPDIYARDKSVLFNELPDEFTSTKVELIYITDRAPETDEQGNLRYGYQRSPSLAVGTTVVDLGKNLTWDDLVQASRSAVRLKDFALHLDSISEFARLPPTPTPFTFVDGKIVEDPEVVAERNAVISRIHAEALRRLALTPRKEVYLYVHGYHNTFEDAAFALAELWHFLGREGLPIIYTWPAGYPGIFGYTYDRESSEFTVFHLKQTIDWLAKLPEVEKIHLIAHSRGTDVTVSALRELVIWTRGAGVDPRERFKIANVVLAAPDLDLQVVDQRVVAEHLGPAVGQTTLYTSPADRAIGFAERLFASPRGRLGTVAITDLSAEERRITDASQKRGNFTAINFTGHTDGYGHSYFRDNPIVSSDLVLLLRYDLKAGESGRPLQHIGSVFWQIPEDYPERISLP